MRRTPPARRSTPIRLIPYGSGPSPEIAVYGSLAVALDSSPPPGRTRPPLGVARPPGETRPPGTAQPHDKAQPRGVAQPRTEARPPGAARPLGQARRTGVARPPLGVVRDGRPDVRSDARLIARLVLEVLAGLRPYHHLAGRTTPELFEHLDGFAARMPTRTVPRLGTVRVCAPAPGVAEVTAIATFGPRVHALALRLEHGRGRWRCAAIETALPPS
ncbi:hypothetical protein GCM10029978_017800 [Actinoallomurus acanthiterrae]